MKRGALFFPFGILLSLGMGIIVPFTAHALPPPPQVPGSADVGRIKPEEAPPPVDHSHDQEMSLPSAAAAIPVPEVAKEVHLTLKAINIEGATAFTPEQLADLYSAYIGQDVTLAVAYEIANAITERYRKAGYFLSLAYVPVQHIKDGVVTIKVVEGHIGKVELPDAVESYNVIRQYIDGLVTLKPVTSDEVESFLLRLNDLPGFSFRAVLSPLENAEEGLMKITLMPSQQMAKGSITFDNYASRFLGPNEATASFTTSLIPLQQTYISGLTSLPTDNLRYGTISHSVMVAKDTTLEVNGGITKAYPGFTLDPYEIDSISEFFGLSARYQWIRQRQENLALKLSFEDRNVTSNLLHTALTRDRIRVMRANLNYDTFDNWHGYDTASVTVSQGISGMGASDVTDRNLSRAGAKPDFTKLELSLSRLQPITDNWSVFVNASGQRTTDVMFSSEQFGYGGQAFGRAFDASDLTSDQGVAGSLEVRYDGLQIAQPVTIQPFGFVDMGIVWSNALARAKRDIGSSAGGGIRFVTPWHQSGTLALAWPLDRPITTPIYGNGTNGPRIILQFSQSF